MFELVSGVIATAVTCFSVFYGIFQKKKAETNKQWSDVQKDINLLNDRILTMEQQLKRTSDRISVQEKSTEKLESTLDKQIQELKKQTEKIYDLCFKIAADKSGS